MLFLFRHSSSIITFYKTWLIGEWKPRISTRRDEYSEPYSQFIVTLVLFSCYSCVARGLRLVKFSCMSNICSAARIPTAVELDSNWRWCALYFFFFSILHFCPRILLLWTSTASLLLCGEKASVGLFTSLASPVRLHFNEHPWPL